MELWSEMNDVVERELKDEIELEFKDEIELDNLVDVFDCKERRLEKETETNDEIAVEEFFKQFVETKASNDEEEILTVEEILRQLISDKTEASNDEEEILTEEIFKQLVDSEKTSGETKASNDEKEILTVEEISRQLVSDKTEASNDEMNDEETRCREKETETMNRIMVDEFYRQLVPFETSEKTSNKETNDEETLTNKLIKTNEIILKSDEIRLKRRRIKENERLKRWRAENDKMERAAMKTIATFVPNLRGKKKRTRLEILEDIIHHFNTCHSS